MKKGILFLSLIFSVLISIAAQAQQLDRPNDLEDTHWTMKKITCESGVAASPGLTEGVRYDVHFLPSQKFEVNISQTRWWSLTTGVYAARSTDQICFTTEFSLASGQDPNYTKTKFCMEQVVSKNQMTWSFPNGGDCPTNDPVTAWFEKQ